MAKKISDLTPKDLLGDTDSIPISDTASGTDKRITGLEFRMNADVTNIRTVPALQNFKGKRDGQVVELLGDKIIGDGGKGSVYWDATSTETPDNATIYKPAGVTTGRWKRNYTKDFIYASWFGAHPDSSDCYAQIQAAIDFAADNTIGKVLLEEGIYGLSQTLKIPSYVYLIGSNPFRTKIRPTSGFTVADPLIQIGPDTVTDGGQACGLKDLRAEGRMIGLSTSINRVISSKGMQENAGIFNCHVVNFQEYGIYLNGGFVANTSLYDIHMFNTIDNGNSYIGIFLDEIFWNGVFIYNITMNGNPVNQAQDSINPGVKLWRSRANIKNLHVENMDACVEVQNGGITGEHLSINTGTVHTGVRILNHTGGEGGPTVLKNCYFSGSVYSIDDQFKVYKSSLAYVEFYVSSRLPKGNNIDGVSFFEGAIRDNRTKFWDGAPLARMSPADAIVWEDDFITFPLDSDGKPVGWSYVMDEIESGIEVVDGLGGELQLNTSDVSNDETYLQLGSKGAAASFRITQGSTHNLWFETFVELLTGMDSNVGVFVGLAALGNASTGFMGDNSTDLRDTDFIGAAINASTPTQWDIVYRATGQATQKISSIVSTTSGVKVRFGINFDGEDTLNIYIGGIYQQSITIDATFPNDVLLQPMIAIKTTAATKKFMKCDFMKIIQNRTLRIV